MKQFKKQMIETGITISNLARLCGRSRETVSRWLREPENVCPVDLLLILSALKYSPEDAKRIYSEIIEQYWR